MPASARSAQQQRSSDRDLRRQRAEVGGSECHITPAIGSITGLEWRSFGARQLSQRGKWPRRLFRFLGAATATSINGLDHERPSSTTLNVVSGKTLGANNADLLRDRWLDLNIPAAAGTRRGGVSTAVCILYQPTNNLSDVSGAATARANPGVTATGADGAMHIGRIIFSDLANKYGALQSRRRIADRLEHTFAGALNNFLS